METDTRITSETDFAAKRFYSEESFHWFISTKLGNIATNPTITNIISASL